MFCNPQYRMIGGNNWSRNRASQYAAQYTRPHERQEVR